MGAIAPVLVTVGPLLLDLKNVDAATAATGTFSPEGFKQPGVTKWVNRSPGIAIGMPALTFSIRPPTQASRVYKVTCKVVIPTLEQTSPSTMTGIQPAPTKAYDCTCVIEFMLPERSTLLERQNIFAYVLSLFFDTISASDGAPSVASGSPLKNAIYNFEDVY